MPLSSVVGAQSIIKPGVCTSSTRPASPYDGQVIYETDTDKIAVYDASAWVYKTGTTAPTAPGIVLTGSASPSASTSVSINNCFTSSYENYRVVATMTAAAGTGTLSARLRASSVDTTTNYICQLFESYSTTTSSTANVLGTDEWYMSDINATYNVSSFSFDIYKPQTAQKTNFNGQNHYQSTAGTFISQFVSGVQTSTTQFDGITILSTTAITGTIRIYGYANS